MNSHSNDFSANEIEGLLKSFELQTSQQFYRSLESAPWISPSHKTTITRNLKFVMASLSIMTLIVVLLFTPVGRAIADGIANFFTTIEGERFEVPEEIILSVTQHAASDLPGQVSPSESRTVNAYVEEVLETESRIGYDLKEFSEIPSGFTFYAFTEFPEHGIVIIAYESEYGQISLQQGLGDFPNGGSFDQVPSHEVQTVNVNNNPAEYVYGYFLVFSGETSATWVSDSSVQRLRWREDDRWFEIELKIPLDSPGFQDMAGLINLASNLVYSQ